MQALAKELHQALASGLQETGAQVEGAWNKTASFGLGQELRVLLSTGTESRVFQAADVKNRLN